MQFIGITIAVLSLLLSLYAIRLGRKNRSYDLLFKFYTDLKIEEHKDATKIEEIVPPDPEEMDEDEYLLRKLNNFSKQESIEAKFNLLCYAVDKGQIPVKDFFALFAPFLQIRMDLWPQKSVHRIANYPYIARVIDRCIGMKLLPLNAAESARAEKRRKRLMHWKEGASALTVRKSQLESPPSLPKPDEKLFGQKRSVWCRVDFKNENSSELLRQMRLRREN
jgi:hypothetical protein